jgi:lipoprotein signal peptidase
MKNKRLQYLFFTLSIIGSCFLVRELVLALRISFVQNFSQEFFRFGSVGLFLFIILGMVVVFFLKPYQKYPILFCIIFAGICSNILEKLIFGYVVDYIYLGIGVANLADFLIYILGFVIAVKELFIGQPLRER